MDGRGDLDGRMACVSFHSFRPGKIATQDSKPSVGEQNFNIFGLLEDNGI